MVVAKAGADAGNFVGRDGCSDAAAAEDDSALGFAVADGQSDGFGEVGIVDGVAAVGSQIQHLVLQLEEHRFDGFLEIETSVVGANGNFHFTALSFPALPANDNLSGVVVGFFWRGSGAADLRHGSG